MKQAFKRFKLAASLAGAVLTILFSVITIAPQEQVFAGCAGSNAPSSYNGCDSIFNGCPGALKSVPDNREADLNCAFDPAKGANWNCPVNRDKVCHMNYGGQNKTVKGTGSGDSSFNSNNQSCPGAAGSPSGYDCSKIPMGCPGTTPTTALDPNTTVICPFHSTDPNWQCPFTICSFADHTTQPGGSTTGQTYQTDTPSADQSATNPSNSEDPELQCNTQSTRMDWIICPVVKIINYAITQLDNALISLLQVDPKIVDEGDPNGAHYYTAWQSFRNIAIGILVIAALIMIIGQALGLEVLDAYTLKKVAPRLIIAILGIALSWELMKWFIIFTNDLGLGVRSLIYAPFNGINGGKINIGAAGVMTYLAVPAIFAMGIWILLLYGATAFLALLIAFMVLVARQIVIVMLILLAPVAIACYVLPNTQGIWKLWHESFTKALLMFPIIMAFLAAGRAFALVSTGPGTGPVEHVVAFIAYIIPYFMIPMTFKFAGGAMRTIGGMANDKSKGMFDRLSKARSANYARRGREWKAGSLYQDRGVGKVLNNVGRRAGVGVRHGRAFGFGEKGRAALATQQQAQIQETLKNNPMLNELQNNDDANAVLAFSGGSKQGGRAALNDLKAGWRMQAHNDYLAAQEAHRRGQLTDEEFEVEQRKFANSEADIEVRGEKAYAAAAAVGFRRENASAALQTVARNKSRAVAAGDIFTVNNGINRLSGGNKVEQELAKYSYEYFSREAGRGDLGGNFMLDPGKVTAQANERIAKGEFAHIADPVQQQIVAERTVAADMTALDGMGRTGVSAMVNGHTNQLKQNASTLERMLKYGSADEKKLAGIRMIELQKNMMYGSGDNQAIINKLMKDIGIDYTANASVEVQIADKVNEQLARVMAPGTSAEELTRAARTYDRETVASGRAAGEAGIPT